MYGLDCGGSVYNMLTDQYFRSCMRLGLGKGLTLFLSCILRGYQT